MLWTLGDLAADLRHRIEGQTFTPETGEAGVQLVDAAAAPFGSFDALHLVGLVDGEWPRRQRRNIFYSPGLLTALGWPAEQPDALAPARAAFVDLLQSPTAHASVSTFSLEDDALVEPSSLLDDIGRAGLTRDCARRPRCPCVPGRGPRLRRLAEGGFGAASAMLADAHRRRGGAVGRVARVAHCRPRCRVFTAPPARSRRARVR